jgi:hypothetical protein
MQAPFTISPSRFLRKQCRQNVLLSFLFFFGVCTEFSNAQMHDTLCKDGDGGFRAESHSGVTVQVRAARAGELSMRSCEAVLSWDKETLTVATSASQIDLDTFGADLGLGMPVASFQIRKKDEADCCMEYKIYSLEKNPRLLRVLTGGDFFSAADTDLDGRVEIWTNDAAAVQGFESLSLAELDAAPTIVLRFTNGKLLDVSSEFQAYFDVQVAQLRKEMDSDALRGFKSSNGKLSDTGARSAESIKRMRAAKVKVLEIVWSYLYSGREEQAWRELAEMWPTEDFARIQKAMLDATARGIRRQIDGVSQSKARIRKPKRVQVFDAMHESDSGKLEVTPPVPIMLRRPPPLGIDKGPTGAESLLNLVIDSAGKVRSAEPSGKRQSVDQVLLQAAYFWKFIPASKNGKAVASRIRIANSLRQ